MTKDFILEVAKLIVPAAVSSAFVTFYFQKRIKRMGDFQEAAKTLMDKLLKGMDDVYQKAEVLQLNVETVGRQLRSSSLDKNLLVVSSKRISKSWQQLNTAIRVHRVYITPFFEFDKSSEYRIPVEELLASLDAIQDKLGTPEIASDIAHASGTIKEIRLGFEDLRRDMDGVRKRILEGEAP
jgi:hypothetical protein